MAVLFTDLLTQPPARDANEPVPDEEIAVSPNPAIGLDSDNAEDAFVELATDIFDLNNMPSLALNYNMQRNT